MFLEVQKGVKVIAALPKMLNQDVSLYLFCSGLVLAKFLLSC